MNVLNSEAPLQKPEPRSLAEHQIWRLAWNEAQLLGIVGANHEHEIVVQPVIPDGATITGHTSRHEALLLGHPATLSVLASAVSLPIAVLDRNVGRSTTGIDADTVVDIADLPEALSDVYRHPDEPSDLIDELLDDLEVLATANSWHPATRLREPVTVQQLLDRGIPPARARQILRKQLQPEPGELPPELSAVSAVTPEQAAEIIDLIFHQREPIQELGRRKHLDDNEVRTLLVNELIAPLAARTDNTRPVDLAERLRYLISDARS